MGVLIMDKGESTRSVHAAMDPEEVTGSVQPPIFQTSTYVQEDFSVHKGYEYARTHNPTREALEKAMAELESPNIPATGICFGSGMAAITAVSQLLSSGDHIIACDDLYGGTVRLFDQVLSRYGIETTYSKLSEGDLEKTAQENTKVLWLESPTNPLLSVHDIKHLASQAKDNGWMVVVDNTFASPVLQRPLDLGADIVLHSTTKYIGGHSDVVGGCVIMRDKELIERLKFLQNAAGAVPGPFDCFLTLRGIRTLALRMERHCDNAEEITERLTKRSEVTRILYPGLKSHPNYHVAATQMRRFGGMISIEIEGGETAARKFAAALKLFSTAESLGGVESLINHPWTMTHAAIPEQQRRDAGMTPGLVRLSVGIEDIEDLWADIVQALQISSQ
jgi:cystathionine beta-lyase/cystathionine gamma-synthase